MNEISRLRESVPGSCCASRSAPPASLLFPFAPHTAADVYDRLTGERIWEQPWPEADEELLESEVRTSSSARSTARSATGCRRTRRRPPTSSRTWRRAAPNVIAHLDGKELVKEIVVPGKLVNLVVR